MNPARWQIPGTRPASHGDKDLYKELPKGVKRLGLRLQRRPQKVVC